MASIASDNALQLTKPAAPPRPLNFRLGTPKADAVSAIERRSRFQLRFGMAVVALFFGGLTLWSVLAPIDSAVVAEGKVIVASNRKAVQSENGGTVREILYRDGDRVNAGDVVLRFDSTKAAAVYQLLLVRNYELKARRARLIAERDGLPAIEFPDELLSKMSDPNVAAAVNGQTNLFNARKSTLETQISILKQQIAQYEQEIVGLEHQIEAQNQQLVLLREEVQDSSQLLDRGLTRKPRYLELKRKVSDIEGSLGQNQAQIARVQQAISAAKLKIVDLTNQQIDEVVTQLRETETQLGDLEERLRAARHDLENSEVRAPASGIVVGTNVHTVGGVVPAGATMMEIVPDSENLIIEARIRPEDIEHVHTGLPAEVRLIGFNRRVTPSVDGEVTYVSADSLIDPVTNLSYYEAKINLDLAAKPDTANLKLQPGMPAQVMVITGTRTLFEYLISPISDSVEQAFREP